MPLGTPLLAGPGAIVATMLFTRDVHVLSAIVVQLVADAVRAFIAGEG